MADNAAAVVYPFGKHNPDYQVGGRQDYVAQQEKFCESAARDDCFEYDAIHTVHGHNGQRCGLCAEGLARER